MSKDYKDLTPDEQDIYDDLVDLANNGNSIEESAVLSCRNQGIETEFFNTFVWINDFYARIQDPTLSPLVGELAELTDVSTAEDFKDFDTGYYTLNNESIAWLEAQWKKIGDRESLYPMPYQKEFRVDNPLELFLQLTSFGNYPPPELLIMITKCFNLYFEAEGALSLEEVFFGRPKKRAGNYSARKAQLDNYREFHYQVIHEQFHKGADFNLIDFALEYNTTQRFHESVSAVNVIDDAIESYIRGYQRWKKRTLKDEGDK